jgi:membrane protease YdiL (CAAX protease family)
MTEHRGSWNRIGFYLLLTFAFSSVFYFLIIRAGHLGAGHGLYVLGLMWSPGLAGLISRYRFEGSLRNHGWRWGGARYQWTSYLLPIVYGGAVYLLVWATGLGGFDGAAFLNGHPTLARLGLPAGARLALSIAFVGTAGMIASSISALGEELGWRGFLVPELAKVTTFTRTALLSGLVWSFWHYPILLFADYNAGTPAPYALACFTVMVLGLAFAFAWLRLKSGSVWTGMILHASHNLWIQGIFDRLTVDTGRTKYVIGEFGIGLALAAVVVGWLFWRRRGELPDAAASA